MENSAPQDAQNNVLLAERLFVLLRLTQLEKEIIHTLRPLYVCWFLLICALFVVRVWRELQHINTPFVVALCRHLSKVYFLLRFFMLAEKVLGKLTVTV